MSDILIHEQNEGVHILTINRPKALNAVNMELLLELDCTISGIANDSSARAVIVTGAGGKAFVAGADISAMQGLTPVEAELFSGRGQDVFDRLSALSVPVIAAIDGFALGGGCELAMACDLIFAGPQAKFGQPEVNLGLIPGFGGTQRLVRRVGLSVALDLCLTGRIIDVDEALRIGLISRKIDGDVLAAAKLAAAEIAAKGAVAVRLCKQVIHRFVDGSLNAGLMAERTAFATCFSTDDQKEGTSAFLERRKPAFQGR